MYTVLFDIDDTLYNQIDPFQKACRELFHGQCLAPIDQLFIASRKYSDEVFEKSQSGQITMKEMYIYRIKKSFADFNIDVSDEEALEFQRLYGLHQSSIHVSATTGKLLDACKNAGVQLGVITNGPSEHQWKKVKSLNLVQWIPQEHIFVSGDLGCAKPDSKIFQHAGQKMNFVKEHTFYIGDSFENDIIGAKNAGLWAIWLNRRNNSRHRPIQPDYHVTTEQQLYGLVLKLLGIKE